MKTLSRLCAVGLLFSNHVFTMDPRAEMMVRYYEGKPIVEKRSSISLDETTIALNDTASVTLTDEGLKASKGVLILDTFSLKYSPKQPYILLSRREVEKPSEHILLVRKGDCIYILDLKKEMKIGQFALKESENISYIALLEGTDGYTNLQINDAKKSEEMELMVYNGENYTRQIDYK